MGLLYDYHATLTLGPVNLKHGYITPAITDAVYPHPGVCHCSRFFVSNFIQINLCFGKAVLLLTEYITQALYTLSH